LTEESLKRLPLASKADHEAHGVNSRLEFKIDAFTISHDDEKRSNGDI